MTENDNFVNFLTENDNLPINNHILRAHNITHNISDVFLNIQSTFIWVIMRLHRTA